MKTTPKILALISALAVLNLSGCMVLDGNNYHNDRGDLVSSDASIRYVGWCEVHTGDRHCGSVPLAAAKTQLVDNID